MFFDVVEPHSLLRSDVDESANQIFEIWRNLPIEEIEATPDFAVKYRSIIIFEGQFGHNHGKEHNPQRSHITRLGIVDLPAYHLRRGVARRAQAVANLSPAVYILDSPKSTIFKRLCTSSSMFSGLTSRCAMPNRCKYYNPERI